MIVNGLLNLKIVCVSYVAPQPKIYAVPEDFLKLQPDDSPGIKKLKKLASLNTTELKKFQEELKSGEK